jgi:hypothetical protein
MSTNETFESLELLIERLRNSQSGRGVAARATVAKLAANDPQQALRLARSIEHPWYRCQAIASIVEANLSSRDAEELLDEAFTAASSQSEPNRVASVAFWPLRLLVSTGSDKAVLRTRELLQVIAKEPHGLRKLDGLRAILTAVVSSHELRELVLKPFTLASAASQGWRTERIIDIVAEILIPFDREAASRLLYSRPPSRYTRRSRALLSGLPGA